MKLKVSSITTKLLLLFLLVGLISVAAVGIYSFYAARAAIIKRTIDQLISVRAVKKQQIEYFFAEKRRNLEFLAGSKEIRMLSSGNEMGQAFKDALGSIRKYDSSYNFSNLYLVCGTGPVPRYLSLGRGWPGQLPPEIAIKLSRIRNALLQKDSLVFIDLFEVSTGSNRAVCLLGKRIASEGDGFEGAVVLEVSSAEINRIMLQNNSGIGLGRSGEAYITGPDLLMRSESRFIPNSVLRVKVNSLSANQAAAGNTGAIETKDYRGILVFSAFEPLNIPGLNWIILAEIDYAESLIPVDRIRNDILLVSVVISLFILALARLISKMITQPIIRLKNAAIKTGQGDFDSRVDVNSNDEIGSLAGTFNTMIDRIREERARRLSAMYDGQEMERQRVSRELHDGLGQKLVGAKLQLENCEGQDLPCLQKSFGEIKHVMGSLIEDTRQISNDLMPPALIELGLVNALENLCRTAGYQSGLEIEFVSHGPGNQPDSKTTVYLFRIAQEGLSNAIRHSGANDISMQLIENKENLILIIEDNGRGFEPEQAGTMGGNGMYNMRERTRILGGSFNVETAPGKGTTIRVKIPKHS